MRSRNSPGRPPDRGRSLSRRRSATTLARTRGPAAAVRGAGEPLRAGARLTCGEALTLFEAQIASRHLDLAARWLRSFNEGYYTIGSSGHEGNAAVAGALRSTDPALLHYRSGAFYLVRAAQSGRDAADALRDVLRGLVASAREPIAGGRHKVFGHADLAVIPTTSTIASHLPRAVGVGFAISRRATEANAPTVRRRDRGRVGVRWVAGRRRRDLLVR